MAASKAHHCANTNVGSHKFMRKQTKKRIWNFVGTVWFGSLMIFGIFSTMTNACTDLDDLDKYEGTIADKGIIQNTSSTSKGPITSDVFFLRLSGLDQTLATYNKEQSYYDLDSKLNVGDRVTVYFKSSPNNNKPNLSTYQIEKDGQVILGQDEFKGKEMIGGAIATLGLGLIITIGYFQDKKYRLKKKIPV